MDKTTQNIWEPKSSVTTFEQRKSQPLFEGIGSILFLKNGLKEKMYKNLREVIILRYAMTF
jgi:hypothetical protein